MSYRTLDALLQRRNLRIQQEDYRSGALCALVANYICAMGGEKRTYTASHFFASLGQIEPDRPQSPEEMREILRDYQAVLKA